MKKAIQTFLLEAGEAACYALCILKIAEEERGREFDVIASLSNGINTGCIHYDWENPADDNNFFVEDPARFLGILTGAVWEVSKQDPSYVPFIGEQVVQRWERVKTGSTTGHFKRPDWDSLFDSQTVKFGKLASLRVFRRV